MIIYIITIGKGVFENFSHFGISNRSDEKSRIQAICERFLRRQQERDSEEKLPKLAIICKVNKYAG